MKKLYGVAATILLIITLILIFIFIQISKPYSAIITMNWSVEIPKTYKEVYSKDSGASFHGDGERYHIFQYSNENDIIKAIDWIDGKNTLMEAQVNKVLNILEIPIEAMPEFQADYKYYTKIKEDSSKLYFIFVTGTKKLYIIEDIL